MIVTRETWVDAQCAVLGSCLIEEKCAGEIVFGLREEDFAEEYRTLYRAIRELYTTGKPVDPVTVLSIVGEEYRSTIRQLMEITPTARNIKHYIGITAEQSRILRIREIGMQLLDVNDVGEAQAIMDSANGIMVTSGMQHYSLRDMLANFISRYFEKPDYLDWFIPALRKLIRLRRGSGKYMILGARPSIGKSAFAMQAAAYWAIVCNQRVGFYSDEMGEDELTERLVSSCCGVSLEDIQERRLSDQQLRDVYSVSSRISEAPLFVIPASENPVSDIRSHALQNHLDIVVIDYLQIVPGRGETEYDRVTRVSHEIQKMCKSTGITVLALSQLSRIRGARPSLEDLRASGQLEQDADIVAFLHKPSDQPGIVEFIIAKNRQGVLGTTKLGFDGSLQRFLYIGKGEKPLKPFDYADYTYRTSAESLPQLSMDAYVPYEQGSVTGSEK